MGMKKFKWEDQKLDLKISIEGLIILGREKEILKLGLNHFEVLLKREKGLELNRDQLLQKLATYEASLDLIGEYEVRESEPYLYGADADGNRGIVVTDRDEVRPEDIELHEATIRLVDEKGDILGLDNPMHILSEAMMSDEFMKFVAQRLDHH